MADHRPSSTRTHLELPHHHCLPQLRDEIGLQDDNPLDDTTIEKIYQEATDWLASL